MRIKYPAGGESFGWQTQRSIMSVFLYFVKRRQYIHCARYLLMALCRETRGSAELKRFFYFYIVHVNNYTQSVIVNSMYI